MTNDRTSGEPAPRGRVLVTGASGFVGRWLSRTLLDHGFAVRGFDRVPAGAEDEIVGDSLDEATVARACHGVYAVCHLIGLQSSRDHTPEQFREVNVRTTERLLEASLAHGVEHFVYFSTEMVYGEQPPGRVGEEAVLRPRGEYGRSKAEAEQLCRRFEARGLRVTILRPCNIMGPGKVRVVEELFARVAGHRPIPMVGGGGKPWQVVDVRDVSELTARVLEQRVDGVYNLGAPDPPSAREAFARLIEHARSRSRLVPVPAWTFRAGCVALDLAGLAPLAPDQYHRLADAWVIDPSRLLDRLSYTPRHGGVRSILDTYDAWARSAEGSAAGRPEREVVVVTGASKGIGRATAQAFARTGARVALVARNAPLLEEVRREIEEAGGEALVVPADVRSEEQVQGVVRRTLAEWGRIDVLVNNAGVAYLGELADLGLDELREMVDVNLVGTLLCIRAVLPHFTANGRGHIVNVSSILGKRGVPRQTVYSASKAAILGLSEALRGELAPHGITVTAFCPSSTETEMNRSIRGDDHPLKQFVRKRFMYTPEAVARRVVEAAQRRRREVVLSLPAKAVVLANRLAPGTLDWMLTRLERPR
jgi:short-subunit dehydrogenase/NAD dependent epimerase/dehydratase family enzyme